MPNTYRLLKDYTSPFGFTEAGIEKTAAEWHKAFPQISEYDFEIGSYPLWFELVSPEPKRFRVHSFQQHSDQHISHYECRLENGTIPHDKFPAIKSAIEAVINDEVPVWYTAHEMRGWLIKNKYSVEIATELSEIWARDLQGAFKKGWEKAKNTGKGDREYEYFPPMFTQKQMDEARKDAFDAGRTFPEQSGGTLTWIDIHKYKFPNFQSYLTSLQPTAETKTEQNSKDYEILEMFYKGTRVMAILENGNDWSYWLDKPEYQISKVRRNSDNQTFSIGDEICELGYHQNETHKVESIYPINGTIALGYGNGGAIVLNFAKKSPTEPETKTPVLFKWTEQTAIEFTTAYLHKRNNSTIGLREFMPEFLKSKNQ